MKYFIIALALVSINAQADCRKVWVDHDYNASTPPVVKQVCDSSLDIDGINLPGIQPIQRLQIKPIESLGIPPLGTTRCRNESVYEGGQWITKRLCD